MTDFRRLTRKQAITALKLAKTDKGRARLSAMVRTNDEALAALENQVRLGVDTPEVKQSMENVRHNLVVLHVALGRFAA
jgi:hypothetical protein